MTGLTEVKLSDVVTLPAVITGSACENCGGELAWREGVGRLVITHAHGRTECWRDAAKLGPKDVERANGMLQAIDELLRAARHSDDDSDNDND